MAAVCSLNSIAFAVGDDERAVRELIGKWDAAYTGLDAKTIAALETPDFELVDRFGNWLPQRSRDDNERLWAWVFTDIYRGKPGPNHTIERVRFITPGAAIVQARAFWDELISLPDGTQIPPHGQLTTFVVVKQDGTWLIASQNVHNQMSGEGPPGSALDRHQQYQAASGQAK